MGYKLLFQGKLVQVISRQVTLPDGRLVDWEIVTYPGAVSVLPLDGQQVVMIRIFRPSLGMTTLEIPAGMITPGETPVQAAARELQEETGLEAQSLLPLGLFYGETGIANFPMQFFLAVDLVTGSQKPEQNEFISVERYSYPELVQMILTGEIVDHKTLMALALAFWRFPERFPEITCRPLPHER